MADSDNKKRRKDDNKSNNNGGKNPMEKVQRLVNITETIQTLGIIGAFLAGFLKPKSGEKETPIGEKEIPDWIMSMFPHLTKEDEKEYGRILASLSALLRNALTNFEERLKLEGIYDEISFRVMLVQARREHIEGIKSPPTKKAEATDIVTFSKLKLRDTVEIFVKELRKAEQDQNKTPEEIFEEQKRIALSFKLIEKKSFIKRIMGNKIVTLLWLVFLFFLILAFLKKTLS